jgi:hypothetical protein
MFNLTNLVGLQDESRRITMNTSGHEHVFDFFLQAQLDRLVSGLYDKLCSGEKTF